MLSEFLHTNGQQNFFIVIDIDLHAKTQLYVIDDDQEQCICHQWILLISEQRVTSQLSDLTLNVGCQDLWYYETPQG